MIRVYYAIVLCLAIVLTYAIARANLAPRWTTTAEPTGGQLHKLSWKAFYELRTLLRPYQPKNSVLSLAYLTGRRCEPWPLVPTVKRGWTYDHDMMADVIRYDIDIDSAEIYAGDPSDKFGRGIRELFKKLPVRDIRGFMDLQMPGGMDFVCTLIDPDTGVRMQVIRAFDVTENRYITQLAVGIKVGVSEGAKDLDF